MWGTSSPGDKLTGDFGNEPDATSISDRGLFRLLAGNLSPGVFRLLQHNRHEAAVPAAPTNVRSWGRTDSNADMPPRPILCIDPLRTLTALAASRWVVKWRATR